MPIITLTTDFGIKDGNVGVMKGVILGICNTVKFVDLSHTIGAQNIREAAYIIGKSWQYFPPGTIHVIVVDPGVGTSRRPIAARLGKQFFICPDNGLISVPMMQVENRDEPVEVVELNQPRFWLPDVSHVFHGRDIFSPCAAHLANGISLDQIGSRINDPVRLHLPIPEKTRLGWRGEVIHIDHFGNIASNIRIEKMLDINKDNVIVSIKDLKIKGLVDTFGERPVGELIALFGSTGNLIVSKVNGDAARQLEVKIGDLFEVIILD